MTTFLKIQDKIQELSKGKIIKKQLSPFIAILLIIIALPFLWFGGKYSAVGNDATYFFSTLGILIGIVGLILLLKPREYFVLAAPRGIIKPHIVNLDAEEREQILELFNKGQIREILKFTVHDPSSLHLELWFKDGHENVYAQLYQTIDSKITPISLVRIFGLDDMKQ